MLRRMCVARWRLMNGSACNQPVSSSLVLCIRKCSRRIARKSSLPAPWYTSRVALLEKARLASRYAATLYKQGGIGEACRYWLVSIEAAPDKLNGFFGAGRAFQNMADYSTAIKYFEPVFHKTSQPALIAGIEDDLGDCWYKLGHPDVARKYYMASRKTHDRANFRALKTLTESYYR